MQRVALRLDVEVGRTLFDKITSLPLQHLESRTSGYWQALFRDVDLIRNTLSGPPAILLADLPFTIIFFGLIFLIAQPLIPVLIVIWVLYVIIAWRSSAVMSSANSEERESTQTRDTLVGEMINGRTTIKALGLETCMTLGKLTQEQTEALASRDEALPPRWQHDGALQLSLNNVVEFVELAWGHRRENVHFATVS